MSATTVFYQECPVCGRNLRIAVKYYGRAMSCAHCQGAFIAGKEALAEPAKEKRASASRANDNTEVVPSISGLLAPGTFAEPQLGEV